MAFKDPSGFVQDVISAYRFHESGLSEYWGSDPPAVLIEGVAHYHMVVCKIREQQRELDRKNREKK